MPVNVALMDKLPKLEIISNFGVGVDAINLDDAKARKIIVTNTPDVLNECVADTALALVLSTLGTLFILYLGETIERERVRSVFSRFVPAGVVDEVLASADENLRLGGVERDCTVLFSDLRGFTSFSETQPAARVIEVVNYYLNEMTEAILAAGGTLIAYMGDGIMAVFGTPLEQDDHADRAVAAAREMVGPRLRAKLLPAPSPVVGD